MTGIVQSLIGSFGSVVSAATDAYFYLVTLLLPGNGTNGAQNNTFLDSSSNNFTITRNGNTTQGTFSPFSQTGWGNYFNGTTDYLSIPDNAAWDITSSGFTVEAWVYITSNGTANPSSEYSQVIASQWVSYSGNNSWVLGVQMPGSSTGVKVSFYSGTTGAVSATEVTKNTWHHIAGVYDGSSTLSVYMDGVRLATAAYSSTLALAAPLLIGQLNTLSDGYQNRLNGYISNLRISNTARYSGASYTVPTAPFSSGTANTSLLTCQDNRFRDASSNAFAITVNGTPSVQAFSPFAPTAAYSAATNGGSGYFDGSGDALVMATASAAINPTTSTTPFTIECWVYNTGTSSTVLYGALGSENYGFVLGFGSSLGTYDSTQTPWFGFYTGGWSGIRSTTSIPRNAWTHLACVFTGSTSYIYQDGVMRASGGAATWGVTGSSKVRIGYRVDGPETFTGYISGARVVIGSNLYPGGTTFTPPTAPPTAITNTQLLLNFTNAGITDATAKNDLETVGNAQISTTQSKFGGSSMYFDGTGDYLLTPANTGLSLGAGDFTVEMWVYPVTFATYKSIWGCTTSAAVATGFHCGANASGQMFIYQNSAFRISSSASSGVLTQNTWNHLAIVRSSGTVRIYVNGVAATSTWATTQDFSQGVNNIGAAPGGGSEYFDGYIDDIRITKGLARYTGNFTPPTQAFALQ